MTSPHSLTSLLASALSLSNASAVGFRLPNQDPEAIARGNAFTATADNPSAIYYNPAGITQLEGHQLSIGLYAISPGIDFTSPTGAKVSPDRSFQFVPQLYYTFSPKESPWSYGVGIFAPYGLAADYGRETPFSSVAIKGDLAFATINPTLAYQINPKLSVGLGLALNYSEISLTRAIGPAPGNTFEFEGDDFALGWNAGLLWQPLEQWSFGLNFRSATTMDYRGRSVVDSIGENLTTGTKGSVEFPMNIALGASYRPSPKWNIEFGVDWTDWDTLDVTVLQGTPFGDVPFPFFYESGFMYQLGVTREFESGYFLSAGYLYSDNSVPDRTLTPLNPDSNLHLFSVGVGKKSSTRSWAFSYTAAYNGGRDVTGNLSATSETADGRYETLNHALNLSYRFSF